MPDSFKEVVTIEMKDEMGTCLSLNFSCNNSLPNLVFKFYLLLSLVMTLSLLFVVTVKL